MLKMDWEKNSFKILTALAKPILIIDHNYQIVGANSAACKSFGVSIDNIVGQNCFKTTHNLDRPCWHEGVSCPVKTAFELMEKTRIVHKHKVDNVVIFEEIIATPIFDDQGEVNFVIEELHDITELIQSKEITEHLKKEIQTLRGIIPICASCKNIRDDKGYWQQVETYVRDRSEADFSHSICPKCMEKLYPEIHNKK